MILCPAAPLTEGALLFGLIDRRGQVSYSQAAIRVTKKLLLELPLVAEQEFRFASPCAQSACVHWSGECSLSTRLSEFQAFGQDDPEDGLPACAIREECRWYQQDGPQMCSHCRIHSRVLF